jgi:hypothetical protein
VSPLSNLYNVLFHRYLSINTQVHWNTFFYQNESSRSIFKNNSFHLQLLEQYTRVSGLARLSGLV